VLLLLLLPLLLFTDRQRICCKLMITIMQGIEQR
jgi:hypothetical protein